MVSNKILMKFCNGSYRLLTSHLNKSRSALSVNNVHSFNEGIIFLYLSSGHQDCEVVIVLSFSPNVVRL